MLRETLKWKTHKSKSTDAGHAGGTSRSSDEISVMEMEQRGCIIQFYHKENYGYTIGGTEMIKTKPFSISKFVVQKAYERVKQNRGSAGGDGLSFEDFE